MDLLVIIAVFYVLGKILKALFRGFSQSSYRRDQ